LRAAKARSSAIAVIRVAHLRQFRGTVIIFVYEQEVEIPQASKKRSRQVRALVPESLITAAANLGQPMLRQVHLLSAVSLEIGKPPRLGRTPQENEFADWLIETISAALNRRTMSKKEMISRGTRQFGLSERRAEALREKVIDQLNAKAWSSAGAPRGERRRTR
jgi:hypothetical protein